MTKRQEYLDVENIEQCLADLEEVVSDPGELLVGQKRSIRSSPAKRQAAPSYDEANQQAICNSFRGVSIDAGT